MINRPIFFKLVKETFYKSGMKQEVVDGLNAMLDEWYKRNLTDLRWLAYMMGTVYRETGYTFQPVREGFYISSSFDKAEAWRKKNLRYYPWYGRGWPQLTWESNYKKQQEKLGIDLTSVLGREKLLLMPVSAAVLFGGMIDGDFTGGKHKLSTYFNATKEDWFNARRIVNILDKAQTYADLSKKFYDILKKSDTNATAPIVVAPKGGDPVSPAVPEGKKEHWFIRLLKALFRGK